MKPLDVENIRGDCSYYDIDNNSPDRIPFIDFLCETLCKLKKHKEDEDFKRWLKGDLHWPFLGAHAKWKGMPIRITFYPQLESSNMGIEIAAFWEVKGKDKE